MDIFFECCVLLGTEFCVGLITRAEESYQVRYVWAWSWSLDNEEALAHYGLLRHGGNTNNTGHFTSSKKW
jgi:hypothetical protein